MVLIVMQTLMVFILVKLIVFYARVKTAYVVTTIVQFDIWTLSNIWGFFKYMGLEIWDILHTSNAR